MIDGILFANQPNTCIEKYDTHYISYNSIDVNIYGDVTTCIGIHMYAIENGRKMYLGPEFLILNGNHLDELKVLDLDGCLKYFNDNIHLKNKYSETPSNKYTYM